MNFIRIPPSFLFFLLIWLEQYPQDVQDYRCAYQCAAITEHGQDFGEAVQSDFGEGEADSVSRVVEGEDEQDTEVEFDQRILEQSGQAFMRHEFGVYKSQMYGDATQENVDGYEECGNNTALREHAPPEGFAFVFFVIHSDILNLKS